MVGHVAVLIRGAPHILWIERDEVPLAVIEHHRFVRCRMLHRKQSWGDFLYWRPGQAEVWPEELERTPEAIRI